MSSTSDNDLAIAAFGFQIERSVHVTRFSRYGRYVVLKFLTSAGTQENIDIERVVMFGVPLDEASYLSAKFDLKTVAEARNVTKKDSACSMQ